MVNAKQNFGLRCTILLAAAAVLTASAWLRGAEYDEQYTLFLTAGTPRPIWPERVFPAGLAADIQAGQAGAMQIAHDLRATDVHPPLYFWAAGAWRTILGSGLFEARLLSVCCALGALATVGHIAIRCGVAPNLAMGLTLGCYGFVYTGGIARAFAMAQFLTLAGLACTLDQRKRGTPAGILLGAAVLANYLAVFAAGVVLLGAPASGRRGYCARIAAFLPFLGLAGWFFMEQRGTRDGQFPPFHALPALSRLFGYAGANLTGGLVLYAPGRWQPVVAAGLLLAAAALLAGIGLRWRHIATQRTRWLFAAAALAPGLGVLGLGMVFNTTPIELRYLSFSVPFVALLVAGALQACRVRRIAIGLAALIQTCSIAGLMLRPETMQPARATASAAFELAQGAAVLLPAGNDGVGLVGAFLIEAEPALPVLIIQPTDTVERIRAKVRPFSRVVLALLAQDGVSRDKVAAMRVAFSHPDWHPTAFGFNVAAYERTEPQP